MRMRRAAVLLPLALASAACFPTGTLTPDGRERVVRSLALQPRHLRVAVYVAPFYGDASRVLVADRPPPEIDLGETPLPPPTPLRVLPPGTPVFVDGVQFPTGPALWTRPTSTPRLRPWLLATVEGVEPPAVLLLAARAEDADDVIAEVGRVLSADDPTPVFQALPDAQRAAILRKEPVEGMGRQAVAMAWGYPDRIAVDRAARTEEWTWSGGGRRALFQDDRLARFASGAASPGGKDGGSPAGGAEGGR
jgi:hypothetical protein